MTDTREPGRVLIVDDNREFVRSLAAVLEFSGHEVLTAYDGEEALALALALRPEACVIDLSMPKMNGYELARRIRAEPWGAAVTLVAVTGWTRHEDEREALRAGFDHHLAKPVDPDVIESILVSASPEAATADRTRAPPPRGPAPA
jgi:CheY-like chemotaxis protein